MTLTSVRWVQPTAFVVFFMSHLAWGQPAPVISLPLPDYRYIVEGGKFTYIVNVTSPTTPTFAWFKDGAPLDLPRPGLDSFVSGVENEYSGIISWESFASGDGGVYHVVVTNEEGSSITPSFVLSGVERAWPGSYHGTIGSGDGIIAAKLGIDNSGELLVFDRATGVFAKGRIDLVTNGAFNVTLTTGPVVLDAADESSNVPAGSQITISASVASRLLEGSISGAIDESIVPAPDIPGPPRVLRDLISVETDEPGEFSHTVIFPSYRVVMIRESDRGVVSTEGTLNPPPDFSPEQAYTLWEEWWRGTRDQSSAPIVVDAEGNAVTLPEYEPAVVALPRLANISSRGHADVGDGQIIAGLVIQGDESLPVLIRAIGPSLAEYGLTGEITRPQLELYSDGELVDANQGWTESSNQAEIISAALSVGAFAVSPTSHDAVIMRELAPGAYSAIAGSVDSSSGILLMEVYDLAGGFEDSLPRLKNISARANVGTGEAVMVAGFVVAGPDKGTVLLRGVGPTLSDYGVSGALSDPYLRLYSGSKEIAVNDDWTDDAANIQAASSRVGAFTLAADSKDAAMIQTLEPGAYSLHLSGVGESTGLGLIEVYELDEE